MQAHIMDSGLENWHDFEVESRREIIALLRSIGEKNQLIRMLIHGESDVCVTSILEVDADHNTVILDRSVNNDQNRRMLAEGLEAAAGRPARATIPMITEDGTANVPFPLADISCGGIAIMDNKLVLGDTIGKNYQGCRIDLPEIGIITVTLQIRNSLDMTLLNNKLNRRLGCQFVDLPRSMLAHVQRYITRLERERNARMAGLG